ncbi:MAG TPA: hypothetical protein PLE74_05725 [Candidatus Cloacimonadota bacterium]|mgnify:CR=1 FL=1|nr:hypothetical protein [Candidatus Cloacimonadota bacterium]HPT71761.1 hypothetical protein [Candidatus Cloacimonadota bacterium]
MKTLFLVLSLVIGSIPIFLLGQTNDISNGFLEVECIVTDSLGTINDTFLAGEPLTYSLSIINVGDYAIPYRSSSAFKDIAAIEVKPYVKSTSDSITVNLQQLDTNSVLQINDELFITKTVTLDKPGKYEFVVTPHFHFRRDDWPDTGSLNRIVTIKAN